MLSVIYFEIRDIDVISAFTEVLGATLRKVRKSEYTLKLQPSTYLFRLVFSSNLEVDNTLVPWAGSGEACIHA